jgi:hypothetical protein
MSHQASTQQVDRGPIAILARIFIHTLAAAVAPLLVLTFLLLAVAPMLLMLLPAALVGIPFLVWAFAFEITEVPRARPTGALRPAYSH